MTASEQPDQAAQWVALARIRRPQGRKGEVFADILTDFPEKFAERRQLWLLSDPDSPRPKSPLAPTPRQVELIAHWLHKGGIVLHFSGVDSISAAETLAGLNVAIPARRPGPARRRRSLHSRPGRLHPLRRSQIRRTRPGRPNRRRKPNRRPRSPASRPQRNLSGRNLGPLRQNLPPHHRPRRQASRNGPPRRPDRP